MGQDFRFFKYFVDLFVHEYMIDTTYVPHAGDTMKIRLEPTLQGLTELWGYPAESTQTYRPVWNMLHGGEQGQL